MRSHVPVRSLAAFALALVAATCAEPTTARKAETAAAGRGRFSLTPQFSKPAAAVYAQRATYAQADFDHVRIVLIRPPLDTVVDTLVTFTPGQPDLTLDLTVDVTAVGETFTGIVDYTNHGAVVYEGTAQITSYAPDQPAPPQQAIVLVYVGPGSKAARVDVVPKQTTISGIGSVTFTATAFDANNAPIAGVPFAWSSSNPTIASVSASGLVSTFARRGTATITATAPNDISASGAISVVLPAASIALVAGGGQTDKVGATLSTAAVVSVLAADGVGVGGVSVTFAAPAGGKVSPTSATTDVNGRASTTLTLGGVVGPQSFAAVAAGFSVSIPETATTGDAATIAAVSGDGQRDTVKHPVKDPLVVRVVDPFGNPVSKAVVSWTRTAGVGSLSAATSTTDADGRTSVSYTFGATPGVETVVASTGGVSGGATFTLTAIAGTASAITIVSGNGQSARIQQALPLPLVVKVTDDAGNPVNGAAVAWSATNGTLAASTLSDATGQASNSLTVGGTVGPATVTAALANGKSVSFTETVQVGVVGKLAFRVGPTNGVAGAAIAPPILVELQDASGNVTAAANAVTIAIGTNPGASTLTGTLTRTSVNGVATFDDLALNKSGTGYTLVVSSAGAGTVTSAPFNITFGAAATLAITGGDQQTAIVNTAVAIAPSVKLVDASGNAVAGVGVLFTPGTGSGSVVPTTPVLTNASGIATLTSWTLGTASGPQTLVAASTGVPGVTFQATGTPGAIAKILVTAAPSAPIAGAPVTVSAQLADAFNNPVTQAGRVVTWTSTNGGSFASSTSTTATNGATPSQAFTTNTVSGTTHVITAADQATPTINGTAAVTTIPGPIASLAIVTQPSNVAQSGVAFPTQPVIQLRDANNNVVPQAAYGVTASLTSGTGTLNGTVTVNTNAAGTAAFTNLRINGTVGAFTIGFGGAGVTPVNSAGITLNPGLPATLAYQQQPGAVTAGVTFAPPISVSVRDADNNIVTGATNPVTLAIAPGTGIVGAVLGGTVTVAPTAGIATFSTVSIDKSGTTAYRLNASAAGLTAAQSAAFLVNPGAAASMASLIGQTQIFPDNSVAPRASPLVVVKDALGNVVPGASVTFTATGAVTVNGGASATVATDAAGQATAFASISSDPATGTVTATVGAVTPVLYNISRVIQGSWASMCHLTTTGQAYCWGDNTYGTLGNGSTTSSLTPVAVSGAQSFSSLMASYGSHQCGLVGSQAFCWGRNTFGELGDTTTIDRSAPVAVRGGLQFASLAAASYTTCGITTANALYCWGWLGGGTLGTGEIGSIRTTPTLVSTAGHQFSRVAVLDDFVCALEVGTGSTYCWGQTPNGTFAAPTLVPAPQFSAITAGFYQVCGLTSTGAAYCWGRFEGVGTGGAGLVATPTPVSGGLQFVELRAHSYDTCGRTTANVLYCWGDNSYAAGGQVGDGTTINRSVPTPVLGGIAFNSLMGGGIDLTCAQSALGQPFCWGAGGEVGDGSGASTTTPVPVHWVQGTAGTPTSLVLTSGNNLSGTAGGSVGPQTVTVRDAFGNGVVGVTVTFAIASGGGTLTGGTAVTGTGGVAIGPAWTLGPTPGVNTMTATLSGVGQVLFTAIGN